MGEQVKVTITAQDRTRQGIKSAEDNLKQLEQQVEQTADEIQGKAVAAFAALAVAIGGSVKLAMDFEASMDRVAAIANASGSEFKELEQTALDMGAKTVFSATQAADAMSYLAMAGFRTKEQIAAIPGVLNMAAAGVVDLASAADIGAGILAGFNLQAGEMGRVADILTKGFTSTNTNLQDLGEAMKFVAPVASALGLSIEEITASVGLLGNAGIKGGNAGRQLRSALSDLLKPSAEAAELMNRLGISAVDSTGQFKSLTDIVQNVQEVTKNMTEAQRAQTVATLMGAEGAAAFLALMASGPEKIRALTTELENSGGTAERIATQQLDNLKGSLEEMKSQFEDAAIALGDSFNPRAEAAVRILTDLLAGIAGVARENPELVSQFGTLGLTIAASTVAVTQATRAWIALKAAMGPGGWIMLGVGAILGVMADLAITSKAVEIQQEKQQENLVKLNSEYERYNRILSDTKSTDEEQKRASAEMQKVKEEIGNLMPHLVSKWDDEGRAIELNTAKIKQNTEETERNIKAKERGALDAAIKEKDAAKAELERLETQFNKQITFARDQLTFLGASPEDIQKAVDAQTKEWAPRLQKAREKAARAVAEAMRLGSVVLGPVKPGENPDDYLDAMASSGEEFKRPGAPGAQPPPTEGRDVLQRALRNIAYLRNTGQITAQVEIAMLEEVKAAHAKTAEERMGIEEQVYRLRQQLTGDAQKAERDAAEATERERQAKLEGAIRFLDHQLRMNQIGTADEITRLREILDAHKLTEEERTAITERLGQAQTRYAQEVAGAIVETQQKAAKSEEDRVRQAIAVINHRQRIGELAAQEEIDALQTHLAEEERYYNRHADAQWSIEERIYGLRQQLRQEDARKAEENRREEERKESESTQKRLKDNREARQNVLKTIKAAEEEVEKTIRSRQEVAEKALQREITLVEERLRQYERQIAREDRLQRIQEARDAISTLLREGAREEVILADGSREMRIIGIVEAEKELQEAIRENERQTERERLQDQVTALRAQLSSLQEAHQAELAAHSTYWSDVKTIAEKGFDDMELIQDGRVAGLATNLSNQLGTLLTPWQTYAAEVQRILGGIGGGTLPPPPPGTTGGGQGAPTKAGPAKRLSTGGYFPGTGDQLIVNDVPETTVPDRYLPRLAGILISEMLPRIPRMPSAVTYGGPVTIDVDVHVQGAAAADPQAIGQAVASRVRGVIDIEAVKRGFALGRIGG